ncbi:MAG: hypothetical protein WB562_06260 [Candidatus Sulfotelmatobacter sp.]
MPSFPNRCQHIKVNGTQCECPALRRNPLCYFHKRHHDERLQLNADRAKRRPAMIDLPVLEDANSIQVSLMQIMRLVITGQIESKTAGLLLYALQTASANLPRTRFEPHMHHVVLDPKSVHETPLNGQIWDDSDFIDEDDEAAMRAQALEEARARAEKKAERDRWAEAELKRFIEKEKRREEAEREIDRRKEAALAAEERFYEQRAKKAELEGPRPWEAAARRKSPAVPNPNPNNDDVIPTLSEGKERDRTSAGATSAANGTLPAVAATSPVAATLPSVPTTPAVMPADHAARRPPAKVSMNEVRKQVSDQIRKALPEIAAAVQSARAKSAKEKANRVNGNSSG